MCPEEASTSIDEERGHEYVDHTSEMTIRVRAPSLAEVVGEATRAFVALVPDRSRGAVGRDEREFRLEAPDRAALLADWLNELVYLGEGECWLPVDVEVTTLGEASVLIRGRPLSLTEPFVSVKAATLHGVCVRETPRGLEAEVTLDL